MPQQHAPGDLARRLHTGLVQFLKQKVVSVVTLVVEVVERFFEDNCPQLAAALAYYAILSLPPLLILVLSAAGLLLNPQDVQEVVQGNIRSLISSRGAQQAVDFVNQANDWAKHGPWWSIVLSIGGVFFGATRAFVQLQTALNRAWSIPIRERQNLLRVFLVKRVISFATIAVMGALFVVFLLLRAVVEGFGNVLQRVIPGPIVAAMEWVSGSTISIVVGTALFAGLYRFLPDTKITWKQVLPGALLTAMMFEGTKSLIALYMTRVSADIFGQAASFAVLMIWFYVCASLFFLGAEFTEVWARRRGRPVAPEEEGRKPSHFTMRLESYLKQLLKSET